MAKAKVKPIKPLVLPREVRVQSNETTEVVVRVNEYKGKVYLDIRKYITTEKYTGFTKDGVSVMVEVGTDLLEAIKTVMNTVEVEGLCNMPEPEDDGKEF